ncbi:MAG: hypothetical protein ACD_75C01395G0002 [uncultured bacterium]|nr:MAG: hypothetical protein ACD_75C01395G0002 [uncultured bacterium]
MPMIEFNSIPGHQATHDIGDGSIAGLEQQVKVIGDKHPGKTASRSLLQYLTQAQQKAVPICVIQEDLSPLDATGKGGRPYNSAFLFREVRATSMLSMFLAVMLAHSSTYSDKLLIS